MKVCYVHLFHFVLGSVRAHFPLWAGGPWGHSYLFLSLSEPVEQYAAWWQPWVRGVFSVAPVAPDLFFSTVKDTVRNDVGFCLSCIYMFLSFLYKCHYLCNWLDCIRFPSLVGSIFWILKNKDKDDLLRKCMLCQNTRLQWLSCVLGDFCLMGSLLATKPPGLKQTVILANMKRKYPQYSNEREIPIGKFTPKSAWFAKGKMGCGRLGKWLRVKSLLCISEALNSDCQHPVKKPGLTVLTCMSGLGRYRYSQYSLGLWV